MSNGAPAAVAGALLAFAIQSAVTPAHAQDASTLIHLAQQTTQLVAPVPRPRPPGPTPGPRRAVTDILEFVAGPFPFDGTVPATGRPFFDVIENGRRGRRTVRGHVYWEDQTYTDQRVLLHIPEKFDLRKPAVIVVYFHGHGARLERDIRDRQRLPEQISNSVANAVLLAPQFAVDAADSSLGNFWEPGAFARFLREGARHLAALYGDRSTERLFANLPVVVVAYSGGYMAAASVLRQGGADKRVIGVVLLDALYGEIEKFTDWIVKDKTGFFVSGYLSSTRARNLELQRVLNEKKIPTAKTLPRRLRPGSVVFLAGGSEENHTDYVAEAWVVNPVTDLLNRLRDFRR